MFDTIRRYEQLREEPPEQEVVAECIHCEGDIEEGDEVLHTDDGYIHPECLHDYLEDKFGWRVIELTNSYLREVG